MYVDKLKTFTCAVRQFRLARYFNPLAEGWTRGSHVVSVACPSRSALRLAAAQAIRVARNGAPVRSVPSPIR